MITRIEKRNDILSEVGNMAISLGFNPYDIGQLTDKKESITKLIEKLDLIRSNIDLIDLYFHITSYNKDMETYTNLRNGYLGITVKENMLKNITVNTSEVLTEEQLAEKQREYYSLLKNSEKIHYIISELNSKLEEIEKQINYWQEEVEE
jgi:hypothetical protein